MGTTQKILWSKSSRASLSSLTEQFYCATVRERERQRDRSETGRERWGKKIIQQTDNFKKGKQRVWKLA